MFKFPEDKINFFQKTIIEYWFEKGRRDLPWRKTSDPWRILVAELLLRKTTWKQVTRVYDLISKYSLEEIIKLGDHKISEILCPLGMNHIKATQIVILAKIVADVGAEHLKDETFLLNLPGVGKYIANAVLCFAFMVPKPALDTNMIRVVLRFFGIASKRSRPREDSQLWDFAESLVPKEYCKEYNWGVLDFANTICKSRNPECRICPLMAKCSFYENTALPG
ncbi:MAG: A/G-specific adenine glycosylase [Nitrososphaerota archaeon]